MRPRWDKNFLIVFLVAGLFAAFILHFYFMSHEQLSQSCFGGLGAGCLFKTKQVSIFVSHLNAMQNLLRLIPVEIVSLFLTIFLAALVGGELFSRRPIEPNDRLTVLVRHHLRKILQTVAHSRRRIFAWLQLLEQRDPAASLFGAPRD